MVLDIMRTRLLPIATNVKKDVVPAKNLLQVQSLKEKNPERKRQAHKENVKTDKTSNSTQQPFA